MQTHQLRRDLAAARNELALAESKAPAPDEDNQDADDEFWSDAVDDAESRIKRLEALIAIGDEVPSPTAVGAEPLPTWTSADQATAIAEGWFLDAEKFDIQADDDGCFGAGRDDRAEAHVCKQAARGSRLHIHAMILNARSSERVWRERLEDIVGTGGEES